MHFLLVAYFLSLWCLILYPGFHFQVNVYAWNVWVTMRGKKFTIYFLVLIPLLFSAFFLFRNSFLQKTIKPWRILENRTGRQAYNIYRKLLLMTVGLAVTGMAILIRLSWKQWRNRLADGISDRENNIIRIKTIIKFIRKVSHRR